MKHAALLALFALSLPASAKQPESWPEKGFYRFAEWGGPAIGVHYCVPSGAGPDTPILIVVPGALRNAEVYRDAWRRLAVAHRFIVLAVEAGESDFPTELDYNAGGVVSKNGKPRSERFWTYSAIEPLFENFRSRFGSTRERYSLYGHSAGGQFVHTFMLFKPDARVASAVAANPAFCMMPQSNDDYPFGPGGAPIAPGAMERWLASPLVVLLGDLDVAPRTKPLSSGSRANAQGPHVLARGLRFYHEALVSASEIDAPLAWRLEIIHGAGHSNTQIAPHAVKYLFPERTRTSTGMRGEIRRKSD